jgi:hypothetical protein
MKLLEKFPIIINKILAIGLRRYLFLVQGHIKRKKEVILLANQNDKLSTSRIIVAS